MTNEFVTAGVNLRFSYAAGEAASRFLIALRDEIKIYGTRCPGCRRVLVPARSFCPRCFVVTSEWIAVGPAGTLIAFAATRDFPLALVRLDGADTALVHRINAANADALRIGLRVVLVFAETRAGNILDIAYFKPEEPNMPNLAK
ncbi:hypothetical protein ANRL1_04847 [Anaerolineae bacterium]|nr:hypothetical protein ANRL1_04847 [Anaerolineae bacterium]